MQTSKNKLNNLFGAATTTFPPRFRDASYTRRVPYNQEVFVDSNRDESLVFEVNELDSNVSDQESARYFLTNLSKKLYADAHIDIKSEDIIQNSVLKNPIPQVFVSTAVGTVVLDISKRRQGGNEVNNLVKDARRQGGNEVKNLVKVYLANIRLKDPKYKTDILITAYEPAVFTNTHDKAGPSGGEMEQIFKDAVYNFHITDWSFFTEEDD